ncbi:hypothetical protein RHMOL_Rhmol09G0072600 [Rhododendron molle]|uniref:Uncharacterized protein n=1 Tax=Rhododendron molle TaxID=49168 RepID=A0ACC0MB44_RHOML|nr:hypothetical protein RHMOL_Rhmol09G0072600 [Rhododendron molle]
MPPMNHLNELDDEELDYKIHSDGSPFSPLVDDHSLVRNDDGVEEVVANEKPDGAGDEIGGNVVHNEARNEAAKRAVPKRKRKSYSFRSRLKAPRALNSASAIIHYFDGCPPTTESPPKKNRANAHKKSFQYRSNLRPLYELIENKKFSDCQIIELKKTPFWAFFHAFTSKKVNYGKIEKNDYMIRYIMQRYFVGKKRTVTDEEIRLLFGIECGSMPLDFKYSNKPHSEFVDRHLKVVPMMTRSIFKDKFDEAFKGKTVADFKDVAIILCLYVCCTLFFAGT